jgi:hypothetical protein
MNRMTRSKRRSTKILCEALEERRLMSLTVEVRNADGSASTNVTSVGQVVTLDVVAVISSANNQPTEDGLQDLTGSFISTENGAHSVDGNLLVTANLAPFKANGSSVGVQQDLNGDGNLDVGSNSALNTTDYFFARASPLQSSSTGTIVGNDLDFTIATLTYTVTNLNEGGQTSINFVPYASQSPDAAGWAEEGEETDNINGTFQAGTPYTLNDPALVPAPTAVNYSATVAENTPTTINELSVDDVVDPLNPASVTIVSPASHGSTSLNSSTGSILYTPAANYTGTDSFTYHVSDNGGLVSNTATVSITVVTTPPPQAESLTSTTFLDQPVTVNVLASATSNGGTLVPADTLVVNAPGHGTATVNQSTGAILYTPSNGYTGSDSFTYTIGNSIGEASNTATVDVTVASPTPATAANITSTTSAGTPVDIDVLSQATLGSLTTGLTVHVATQPTNGTAAVQSDGSILYTPTAGYTGTDSFDYVIVDSDDVPSNDATISLNITAVAPPTGNSFTAPVSSGTTTSINVLANVTHTAPLVPSSVKVITAPADGTATVNTDGTVSYTPVAGFIGSDSFAYTAADTNGNVSAPATVSVDIGTTISSAKGAEKTLTFTDAAGAPVTVSLNSGSAQIFFSGTGSLTTKGTKATVAGSGLELGSITLTGTSKASTLSIKASPKAPVTVSGITDASPLGAITTTGTSVSGAITLNSAGKITLGSVSNATITIASGAPGTTSITTGAVSDSSLTSAVPIKSLTAASWSGSQNISAPSITAMTIKAGGLAANISTGALGALTIGGTVTGDIIATSAKSIKLGALSGSNVVFTANSGTIVIAGSLTNSTIQSLASIKSVTAGSISGSNIVAGASGYGYNGQEIINFDQILATNIGSASIGSVKSGSFIASIIEAGKIGSASLGDITTANNGTAFGVATTSLGSFKGVFAGTALSASHSVLTNEEVLQDYVNQKGVTFADFGIELLS